LVLDLRFYALRGCGKSSKVWDKLWDLGLLWDKVWDRLSSINDAVTSYQ